MLVFALELARLRNGLVETVEVDLPVLCSITRPVSVSVGLESTLSGWKELLRPVSSDGSGPLIGSRMYSIA